MLYGGKTISNGNEICDAFNQYFNSVFIPCDPLSQQPFSVNTINENSDDLLDISTVNMYYDRIVKELKHVNVNKGAGSDNIHPILISVCATELSMPITYIFRHSLKTGVFPDKWKQSLITPIPKNKRRDTIEEYRPISKLCILGKVLEKVVTADVSYLVRNFISPQQHGFFKHRSVDTNMITFTDYLSQAMDNNLQVDVVYTDFSKAFDKLNHDHLIDKLSRAGLHGNLLRWIKSYITNRSQAVCVKGYCSKFLPVPSGVPQGSHLGPLLFSLYINDMGSELKNTNHLLYADDTKLFTVVKTLDDCYKLQEDLNALSNYCLTNQMFLNIDKCNVISYSRKINNIDFDYKINQISLKKVYKIRDLGIIMDSKLSFNLHIDHVLNKAFRRLGFILRITKSFNKINTLKILYFSYVRSILDYCCSVWSPCYQVHINRIEKVQKKFLKTVNFRRNISEETYNDLLIRYKLLSLYNRRKMYDLIFLYKILNNLVDSSTLLLKISFLARARFPVRPSRLPPLFAPPQLHKNYTRNSSFVFRSTNTYNKEFATIDIFSSSLNIIKQKLISKLGNFTD